MTFKEHIIHFVLSGCAFSSEDYTRHTGHGSWNRLKVNGKSEFQVAKKRKYISTKGEKFDIFTHSWNENEHREIEEMEAASIICEVLDMTRAQMREYLKGPEFDLQPFPDYFLINGIKWKVVNWVAYSQKGAKMRILEFHQLLKDHAPEYLRDFLNIIEPKKQPTLF